MLPLFGRNISHIQLPCWWRSRRAVLSQTRLVASCVRRSTAICLIASRSRREEQQCCAAALIGIRFFGGSGRATERKRKTSSFSSCWRLLPRGSSQDPRFSSCTDLHFSSTDFFLLLFLVIFSVLDRAECGRSSTSCSWKAPRTERVSTGIVLPPHSSSTNNVAAAPSPAAELRISISAPFTSPPPLRFLPFLAPLLRARGDRHVSPR